MNSNTFSLENNQIYPNADASIITANEQLFIEVEQRSINKIYPIRSFPCTVGRALDNDIILRSATVSAHHFRLDHTDGIIKLTNLTNENGCKLNSHRLKENQTIAIEPLNIKAPSSSLKVGNLSLKLVSSNPPCKETVIIKKTGFLSLFTSPVLSMLLFGVALALNFLELYLKTITTFNFSVDSFRVALVLILIISIYIFIFYGFFSRFMIISSIALASLISLSTYLFEQLLDWLWYYFNTDDFYYLSLFLVSALPIIICFIFLKKVAHSSTGLAIFLSFLLNILGVISLTTNLFKEYENRKSIGYQNGNSSLSALSAHSKSDISIDQFIDQFK